MEPTRPSPDPSPGPSLGPSLGGLFSVRIEDALRAAFDAHSGQTRKGQSTPYMTHPVHVALILARAGADDVTLQAALLHDVVEDCEGWTLERVAEQFGPEVASIVDDLTEEKGHSWEERKGAALRHVETMCERALAIKAADKLHNMQSLLASLDEAHSQSDVWDVFSRGPEETLAYAGRLSEALERRLGTHERFGVIARELVAVVRALHGS